MNQKFGLTTRASKMLAHNRIILIGASIIFLASIVACSSSPFGPRPTPTIAPTPAPEMVSAEGTVLPAQRASLAFKTGGRVSQVSVKEGDAIKTGALLARQDNSTLQAQVAQAEAAYRAAQISLERVKSANAANVAVAQANLNKLLAGYTEQEIAVADGRMQEAATFLARTKNTYDVLRWVGGPTEADLRYKVEQAKAAYDAAVSDLQRLRAGSRPEDIAIAQAQLELAQGNAGKAEIAAAEAQVKQAQAALDVAKVTLQDTDLNAPFDGTVALVTIETNQWATGGTAVVLVGNLSKLEVETSDLAEVDVVKVQIGQTANINADAFPDKIFKGQVVRIAQSSSDRRGDKVFKVVISLGEDAALLLKWGMTTKVDILVGK